MSKIVNFNFQLNISSCLVCPYKFELGYNSLLRLSHQYSQDIKALLHSANAHHLTTTCWPITHDVISVCHKMVANILMIFDNYF